jgi:hypothetical protein
MGNRRRLGLRREQALLASATSPMMPSWTPASDHPEASGQGHLLPVGAEKVIRPSGEGQCISRPVVSHRRTTVAHLVRPRVGSCVCAATTSPLIAKIELTHSIASIHSSCSQGRMRFSAPTGCFAVIALSAALVSLRLSRVLTSTSSHLWSPRRGSPARQSLPAPTGRSGAPPRQLFGRWAASAGQRHCSQPHGMPPLQPLQPLRRLPSRPGSLSWPGAHIWWWRCSARPRGGCRLRMW